MKERLIGAAVLVVIGVWLIPWILDGREAEPKTEVEGLQLPAEPDSAAVRTQTIDLDERRSAAARVSPPAVKPASDSDAAADEAHASTAVRSDPVARAESAPPPEHEAKAEPKASAPKSASAAQAPSAAQGDWVVQLGSFGEEANAKRLAERVSTYGYKAEVSTYRAGGRVMHRVRVGPHETRARAESVASSLSAHGFVAQVVAAE